MDAALGAPAPEATGTGFDGLRVELLADGEPTVIGFFAHWCPVCQDEVDELADHLRDGGLPDDVRVVAVSTSVRPEEDNYPPSAWFADEQWPTPILLDDDNSTLAQAYGLSAFPFWVVVDADGTVVGRLSGAIGPEPVRRTRRRRPGRRPDVTGELIAIALGLLVGLSLGALGGGGSTLAVPILVFVAGLEAQDATTASLLVVGVASAFGVIGHYRAGNVRLGAGIAFGAAGIVGSRIGTLVNQAVDEQVLLLAFSALIVFVAVRMYRSVNRRADLGAIAPVLADGVAGSGAVVTKERVTQQVGFELSASRRSSSSRPPPPPSGCSPGCSASAAGSPSCPRSRCCSSSPRGSPSARRWSSS